VNEYQDKIRTIGVSLRRGKSHKKPVTDERDGTTAGYHIEHWDDHVDAVATPKPVEMNLKVNEEE
jgi:hypothetical protein